MFLAFIVLCLLQFSRPEYVAEASGPWIGRIIIEGNDSTPQWVIHSLVRLEPGQKLRAVDLLAARQRLHASKLFSAESPPDLETLADNLDGRFIDVRVRIGDRQVNWYIFSLPEAMFYVATHLHVGIGVMSLVGSQELFDFYWGAIEALAEACHK